VVIAGPERPATQVDVIARGVVRHGGESGRDARPERAPSTMAAEHEDLYRALQRLRAERRR
jgi:hypothetical protein